MAGARRDSSSSSDSDEEENARLREAAFDFVTKDANSHKQPNKQCSSNKASLRYLDGDVHEEENELRTTPEFRAHVAKKLSSILDGSLAIKTKPTGNADHLEQDSDSSEETGFKLFSSSKPQDANVINESCPMAKRKISTSSSSEDEEMFSSVAVSGQYILEGAKTDTITYDDRTDASENVLTQDSRADESSHLAKKKHKHKASKEKIPTGDTFELGKIKNKQLIGGNAIKHKQKHKKKKKLSE